MRPIGHLERRRADPQGNVGIAPGERRVDIGQVHALDPAAQRWNLAHGGFNLPGNVVHGLGGVVTPDRVAFHHEGQHPAANSVLVHLVAVHRFARGIDDDRQRRIL